MGGGQAISAAAARGCASDPRLLQREAEAGVATAEHTQRREDMRIENVVVIIWDELTDGAEQYHQTFQNASDMSDLVLDRDLPAEELNRDIGKKLFGEDETSWRVTGSMEIEDVTLLTTKTERGHRGTVQIVWLGAAE